MKNFISVIHWIPRILCILVILLISMFAFDSFESGLSFWQQIGRFLVHLIPTYILVLLLLLAWKWEYIGGIFFTLAGLGLSPVIFFHNYKMNHSIGWSLFAILIVTIPFVVAGLLFIISHNMKKITKV